MYRICNADGKRWVLPVKNMRTALGLYQPSGAKGRLLKRGLPWVAGCCHALGVKLSSVPVLRRVLGLQWVDYALPEALQARLEAIWGDGLEFAVFEGTPSVHRKTTIQLSRGKEIVGYCKLTESEDIYRLFENERRVLEALHAEGIDNVPVIRYCGEISPGMWALVQSTTKNEASEVVHEWCPLYEGFLLLLHSRTYHRMAFEETEYCRGIMALKEHLDWVPEEYRASVERLIDRIMARMGGTMVDFGAYHGDFTPWNMFVNAETGLFVFDWEYAGLSYPAMLDKCHFLSQTAIFEHHMEAAEVREYVTGRVGEELYELYLADVIARYVLREGKAVQEPEGVLLTELRSVKIKDKI